MFGPNIRPRIMHCIDAAYYTSCVAWSVCLSVCLSVCACLLGTQVSPTKTAEPIEMPFRGLTCIGTSNHVLDGDWDPHKRGNFVALSGPMKSTGSLYCGVCSKRNHSIVDNGCNAPYWLVSYYIVPRKKPPLRCGLLPKFFDHMFTLS